MSCMSPLQSEKQRLQVLMIARKIGITGHEIMTLITCEVIILVVIVLIVRLVKLVYRLCNFNNLQMPGSYVKQNCCPIRTLGNKSDIFLEISSITNVSSIRIYIGTTMGYPTQSSMSGKCTNIGTTMGYPTHFSISGKPTNIGTTMGYPTQFSMSGKLTKGDIEYHTSILYD